jgi:3',5'-cyclic AMP phosphodiesterase CpdA
VGKLVRQGAKWFVPLGDLQYEQGGYDAFMQVYDRSFGQFMGITEPLPGNHEYYTGDASGYFHYFGKRAGTPDQSWHTFSPVDGWQVLLLNSNCEYVGGCGPHSPQGRWITKTLAASTADCVVAAWHHPLRTSGEYHGVTDSSDRAAQLWELVDAGGVDLVLNGHDHLYERFRKFGGVQQFTVGTGGKNPYDITASARGSLKVIGQRYGVLELTMDPRGTYDYAFVATNGHVLDSGTGRCTNEPQ